MQLLRRPGESLLLSFLISNSLMTVPLSVLTHRLNSQNSVVSKLMLLLLTWVSNKVGNQILLVTSAKGARGRTRLPNQSYSDSFASNQWIIFVLRAELAAPMVSLTAGLGWTSASAPVDGSARNEWQGLRRVRESLHWARDHRLDLLPALEHLQTGVTKVKPIKLWGEHFNGSIAAAPAHPWFWAGHRAGTVLWELPACRGPLQRLSGDKWHAKK